jgi:D-3-phosphoglycerate dehydrogenase
VLRDLDRDALLDSVPEAEILWVRLRNRIDRQVMDAGPQLRAIASPTTGLNHIDLIEAQRRSIEVISLVGASQFLRTVYATAEHTIALILGLMRHLHAGHEHVLHGGWNRDLYVGRELHGKTAGVVGYGRVGQMVGGYLQALGMNVLVADIPTVLHQLPHGIQRVPFSELLMESDFVTLHVPLNSSTRGFFSRSEFAQMKPGSWFFNTARGELVAQAALLHALQTGRLAGAALDVLPDECSTGMSTNPIVQYARTHSNVLITPHIAGCTHESRAKTEEFLAARLVEFIGVKHATPGASIFSVEVRTQE